LLVVVVAVVVAVVVVVVVVVVAEVVVVAVDSPSTNSFKFRFWIKLMPRSHNPEGAAAGPLLDEVSSMVANMGNDDMLQ
jgi:hypothetical protein